MKPLNHLLILDGAMGSELFGRGLKWGELPERWLFVRPEEVVKVHAACAAAGAELLMSCTFNLASPRLGAAGVAGGLAEVAARAVELARSSSPNALVAGAVGPTGLAVPGGARPDAVELAGWYRRAAGALRAAGADLLWAESQWSLDEAKVALAAMGETGLPVAVTLSPRPSDGSPDGAVGEMVGALSELVECGAAAVGLNCSLPDAHLAKVLAAARAARLGVPLIAKPSAGLPGRVIEPADFARWIAELRDAGAGWVGGCCGASPAHLAAAARLVGHGVRAV
jgi:5-methyltetrahydrofolate--homocysteine methyltransferase